MFCWSNQQRTQNCYPCYKDIKVIENTLFSTIWTQLRKGTDQASVKNSDLIPEPEQEQEPEPEEGLQEAIGEELSQTRRLVERVHRLRTEDWRRTSQWGRLVKVLWWTRPCWSSCTLSFIEAPSTQVSRLSSCARGRAGRRLCLWRSCVPERFTSPIHEHREQRAPPRNNSQNRVRQCVWLLTNVEFNVWGCRFCPSTQLYEDIPHSGKKYPEKCMMIFEVI